MTPPAVRLPNFFLAGVPKAGTTSLYFYLRQHPQVFMSRIKEPTFFGAADLLAEPYRDRILEGLARDRGALQAYLAGPQTPPSWRFVLQWDDYVRLFKNVRDESAIGEASTGYFWLPSAAAAIRARVPDARVAVVLRDPGERLFSLYLVTSWRDPRVTFRSWFETAGSTPHLAAATVGAGRYATHLARFFDVFPRDRLRVYLYEDYRADARALLRDFFAFLNVDPGHPVDFSRRLNETAVPRFPRLHALRQRLFGRASPTRWLPERARRAIQGLYRRPRVDVVMDPADRAMVIEHYRDEIERTADLIERDLSAWLH